MRTFILSSPYAARPRARRVVDCFGVTRCQRFSLTPKDNSFYKIFTDSANNLVAATQVLADFVHLNGDRVDLMEKLHEHNGDTITHSIFKQLNSSFVTPFDREDIYNLASDLNDVMDAIEAAADIVVLTGLGTLPADMAQQVELILRAAQTTAEAMPRLQTMKDLPDYWIEVNRLENEADLLEEGADAFEHVANVVETIAVKES